MAVTPSLSKTFTLVWTIENADRLFKDEFTYSPCFSLQPATNNRWYFIICQENRKGFFEVILQFLGNPPLSESSVFKGEISVLKNDGSIFKTVSGKRKLIWQGWFTFPLMKTDELLDLEEELYSDNNLVLYCRLWCYGTAIQTSNLCYGLTTLSRDRDNFLWPIRKFSSLKLGQTRSVRMRSDISFPSISVNISLMEDGDNLEIEILREYSKIEFVTKWRVAIVKNRKILNLKSILWDVTESKLSFNLKHFIKKSDILAQKKSFLRGDTLLLHLKCILLQKSSYVLDFKETSSECNNSDLGLLEKCHHSCCFEMELIKLYKDSFESDVNFQVGYETFPIHKGILSSRSSVFKSMFTVDMLGKEEKCIKLENIDPDTFRRLLVYIYTDTIEDRRYNSVVSLYSAANEYDLFTLRKICSEILKYKICISNAFELLDLAVVHGDKGLKNFVESFLWDQRYKMIRSKEWEVFRENNLSLASDIMQNMLEQLKW